MERRGVRRTVGGSERILSSRESGARGIKGGGSLSDNAQLSFENVQDTKHKIQDTRYNR